MDYPVIYLTGAPATGKSSLARNLASSVDGLLKLSYSELLATYICRRTPDCKLNESNLRSQSAKLITRADVEAVDKELLELVAQERTLRPIVIDSHPVTKEEFGFRVTPFRRDQLLALRPDVILCLYLSPEDLEKRIRENPMGRPLPPKNEIDLHTNLQGALAVQYGFLLDCPVYLLNGAEDPSRLCEVAMRLSKLASIRLSEQ